MIATRIVLALSLLGAASAVCPNQCSGHGTCGADDVCTCYQNWGMADEEGGDCSELYCPFEFAWVDTPDESGRFHKYMECAGKGLCDRSTGDCECFEGYTGKGCQRMTCPNECSGHGTCEFIDELTFGSVPGQYWGGMRTDTVSSIHVAYGYDGIYTTAKSFAANAAELWDSRKSMACVCDAGWIDVDCSRRMCPKANDVMDERLNRADTFLYQIQNITLFGAGKDGNGTGSAIEDFYNQTFALTFTSVLNESYTTVPIRVLDHADSNNDLSTLAESEARLGNDIEIALQSLPNKVVTNVNADASYGYEYYPGGPTPEGLDIAYLNINVEFVGSSTMGPQNLLTVEANSCGIGCTPQLTGLNLLSVSANLNPMVSFVTEKQQADYNNYECGRRGKCDYDKGLCECFEGYTGEACSIQTALV